MERHGHRLAGPGPAAPDPPEPQPAAAAKYPAKLHARRVAAELGADAGLVYLAGQEEVSLEDSDQERPFRQRRYFFYVAGLDFAGCHATYDLAADSLVLWVPRVAPRDVLWHGSTPSPERCRGDVDADDVRYADGLAAFVARYRAACPAATVFVLHESQRPPPTSSSSGGGGDDDDDGRLDAARLRPAMDRARVVKTDFEVAMVRRANDVSSAAHRRVAERLLGLGSERDVEAVFQAACTRRGARAQAYGIIAAGGAHAATLHYVANDAPLAGRQLLLLDAGCEWRCYASDVTRTLPLSGAFSPRAAAVHAVVQRMQDECLARLRPGAAFRDLHARAAAAALAGLLRLGVLRGDAAEIARAGTVAAFFPHGLGHHVGLEVHDVDGGEPLLGPAAAEEACPGAAVVAGKRATVTPAMLAAMVAASASADGRGEHGEAAAAAAAGDEAAGGGGPARLRPNMIVTVEPGIYFCRPYLEAGFVRDALHGRFIDAAVLERFYDVGGVRIEDCVRVTRDGHEVLTTAPRGAELLDVINRGR